ncbi:unnamed protein product [Lepeophtheirus salmonis]|uniref:(salmon louse) hypothetical protein n=1 Tax=Lepeophtheirus salmonis TaxID=72036 RepID=A0A7R8H6J1_LEPSM|nr:unnamed protein product [Lepeophtheirus salmonis]CAF2902527.1 unnamed protein product [Lepeophtheirus salmonis]
MFYTTSGVAKVSGTLQSGTGNAQTILAILRAGDKKITRRILPDSLADCTVANSIFINELGLFKDVRKYSVPDVGQIVYDILNIVEEVMIEFEHQGKCVTERVLFSPDVDATALSWIKSKDLGISPPWSPNIRKKRSKDHAIPDALSRAPVDYPLEEDRITEASFREVPRIAVQTCISMVDNTIDVMIDKLKQFAQEDEEYKELISPITEDFPLSSKSNTFNAIC